MKEMIEQRRKRAKAIKEYGTLRKAVEAGALEQFQDVSLSEAVVLGLVNQEVRTFVGIFGHGMTDVGEALRIYEEEDVIKTYNVRNEVEASHIASMLRWKYNQVSAVFTSIGPGGMQATAGSLVPLANGLGIYYLMPEYAADSKKRTGIILESIVYTGTGIFTSYSRSNIYSFEARRCNSEWKRKKIPILYASSNEYPTEGYDRV